jgi:hypothetical protein
MKTLFLAAVLLAALPVRAQIAFKAAANNNRTTAGTTVQATIAIDAGDTVIAFFYGTPNLITSVTDSCSASQWSAKGSNQKVVIYRPPDGVSVTGNCTITGSQSQSNSVFGMAVVTYSGVVSVSTAPAVTTYNQANPCAVSLTTTQANSVFVSFAGLNSGGTNITYDPTHNVGTMRLPPTGTGTGSGPNTAQALIDQSVPASGTSVTNSWTYVTSLTPTPYCGGLGLELLSVGAATPGPDAQLSDQGRSMLMNYSADTNYFLPSTLLSATFCNWVMGVGPATYHLAPRTGATLNGQTGNMDIPPWQMTRLCQGQDSRWWASPPLVAGSGISITASPSAITISSSGTGPGGTILKVAAGTVTLGTTPVPANQCISEANVTAPAAAGVQATDVVQWSRQSSGTGWGNGTLTLWPQAFAGSIDFAACNSSGTSITPQSIQVNWQVLR